MLERAVLGGSSLLSSGSCSSWWSRRGAPQTGSRSRRDRVRGPGAESCPGPARRRPTTCTAPRWPTRSPTLVVWLPIRPSTHGPMPRPLRQSCTTWSSTAAETPAATEPVTAARTHRPARRTAAVRRRALAATSRQRAASVTWPVPVTATAVPMPARSAASASATPAAPATGYAKAARTASHAVTAAGAGRPRRP